MRINFFRITIILVISSTLIACGSFRKNRNTHKSASILSDLNTEKLRDHIQTKRLDYEWWQAKAKIYATMDGDAYSLQGTIKMKKNELIWISLRKLGFEVARIYITPDSVVALNRLERTIQVEKTADFAAKYGFTPDFGAIQDLIIGNPFTQATGFKPEDKNQFLLVHHTDQEIQTVQRFSLPNFNLTNLVVSHRNSPMQLRAFFSQYQVLKDNKYFSYLRTYEFKGGTDDQANAEIQYSDIQMDTPFDTQVEIPARYERI
jgi:hypothetical protein